MDKKAATGSSSRVRVPGGVKKRVVKQKRAKNELIEPKKELYTLSAYEKRFKTQAPKDKVRTFETKSGRKVKGVVVRVGTQGVYELKTSLETSLGMDEMLLDADDMLHEGHADDVLTHALDGEDDEDGVISEAKAMEHFPFWLSGPTHGSRNTTAIVAFGTWS